MNSNGNHMLMYIYVREMKLFCSKSYVYLFVGNPQSSLARNVATCFSRLVFQFPVRNDYMLFSLLSYRYYVLLSCRRKHFYSNTLMLPVLANSAPRSLKVILSSALTVLVQVS